MPIVPSSSHLRTLRVFSSEASEGGGLNSSDEMLEVYLKHKSNPFFAIDSLQSSISTLSVSVKQQGEQLTKQVEHQSKQVQDVQLQLRKQGEDQSKQIQDVQLQLRKQGEDQSKQIQDVQLQLRKQGEDQSKQIQEVQLQQRKQGEDIQFVKGALTVLTPIGVGVAGLVLKVTFFPG
jgi:hypothetical protein